jgi:signal peptidase I
MLPLIQNGDQVLVAHGTAGIRRGDVVVFRQEGQMVAHRVLRIVRKPHKVSETVSLPLTTFLMKGDNNFQVDPPVQGDEIVGRVVLIKRGNATIAVDTFAWRVAGRCIALGTLVRLLLYRRGASLKRRLLGAQANFVTKMIHRFMLAGSSLMLSLVNRLLSRC